MRPSLIRVCPDPYAFRIFPLIDRIRPVPQRTVRLLTLWFFLALQTMTPFIHAHAGAVQLSHAGLPHEHGGAHGDAAYHVMAADEHGAEGEVAHGMPLRNVTHGTAGDVPPVATVTLPQAGSTERPGTGLPAPPRSYLPRPDHTLPHALAPPLA